MTSLLCTLALTLLASPIGTVGGVGGGQAKRGWPTAPAPLTALAVGPREQFALTGSAKGELRRYALKDPLTFSPLGELPSAVSALTWTADAAYAATDRGHLFVIPKDGPPRLLAQHPAGVRALAAAPGMLLSGGDDGVIRLWSTDTGEQLGELAGHSGPVTGLVVAKKGDRLWSVGWDRTLREWTLKAPRGKTRPRSCGRQRFKHIAGPREACGVAVSPKGDRLLTTCWDGALRLWRAGKKRQRPEVLAKRPFQEWTSGVAFDATGDRAVAIAPAESRLLVVDLTEKTPRTRSLKQVQAPSVVALAQGKALVGRFDGSLGWVNLDSASKSAGAK